MKLRRPRRNPRTTPTPAPSARTEVGGERLQKLLAAAGYGSRREVEAWIAAGRITLSGRVARLGDRVGADDEVTLDGIRVDLPGGAAPPRVILYHKPEGEIVTRSDPGGRPTVFARMPALPSGRWVAVGRLDLNSSGLLLLTNSGALANHLMHPRQGLEREYAVRVLGILTAEQRRRLLSGVTLEDGLARFERLEPAGKAQGANRWYRVTLREGRKREVRRLFETAGLRVSRLIRVRFGPLHLPRDLKPGRWRELGAQEVRRLAASEGVQALFAE